MTIEEWLGSDYELGIDIWKKKYQYNNETFDEWLDRVSNKKESVKKLILEKKFLFGGRILSNRGITDINTTYSNCYVISPPEDNLESIYDTCSKLARTYSYGGGCGIDISKLAPEGARVRNQAKKTSGAVSFMDTFSQVTQQIGQNGRRGALMISIDCTHPDLEKFITVKSDLDKVTYANISVRVTDEFMEAVANDADWLLYFNRPETNEKISKKVKAKDIYRLLCENNWNYAEPGILFWDNIEKKNLLNTTEDFKYAGTNPCLTGDTLISTTEGEIPIKDLVGTEPFVYCMNESGELCIKKASKVWLTRSSARIVEVKTARGCIRCTPDHLIHTRNRGWVPAQELKRGDRLTGLNRMMGDEIHVSVSLTGSKYVSEHRLVASAYYDIEGKDVHHIDGDTLNNTISNLQVLEHSEHSRISNVGHVRNPNHAEKGYFAKADAPKKKFSFNLNCGVGTNWFVKSVEFLDTLEDVYDITVPEVHNFVANRIVVHNCAEEPLPAGGACLLGALNLSEFIVNSKFDFDEFKKAVRVSIEALNDVLEEGLDKHPLEEQRETVKDWRQVGLGIMGLADMLIKLGITYGSPECVAICEDIGSVLANESIFESSLLAKDNGTYNKYSPNVLHSYFMYWHDEYLSFVEEYGLRNSQLLTIAPTGSTSTMIGVSGGIEPIFAYTYTRMTKSLHGHDEAYEVYTPIVADYMNKHGLTDISELPEYFVTSATIPIDRRIATQSAWQHHIDASISSTVNLPNSATVEDVENLYMKAWKYGLKGITVYRSGCKRTAILTDNKDTDEENIEPPDLPRGYIIQCSDDVIGKKRKLQTGCGSLHVSAWFDTISGDMLETFFDKGSTGGCNNFMIGLSRMISLLCRAGVDIHEIKNQLDSCGVCPSYATRTATKHDTSIGSCCPVAIGNALIDMYNEMQDEIVDSESDSVDIGSKEPQSDIEYEICPKCGKKTYIATNGCGQCLSCSYSPCS